MMIQTKRLSMEDILKMSLVRGLYDENDLTKMRVNFKKVVNTAQYETETFESEVEVYVPRGLTGIEMEIAYAVIESQLEYGILAKLFKRGSITDTEFETKRSRMEDYVSSLFLKAQSLGIEEIKYIG